MGLRADTEIAIDIQDGLLQNLIKDALTQFFDNITITNKNVSSRIIVTDKENVKTNDAVVFYVHPPLRIGTILDKLKKYIYGAGQALMVGAIEIGPYILQVEHSFLMDKKSKKEIRLTEKERDILFWLYKSNDHSLTRKELLDAVWGYAKNVETHTLETHIYRLRKKIENDPVNPSILITDGAGYRLIV